MLITSVREKAALPCLAAAFSLLIVSPVLAQETREKFEGEHEQEYRQAEFLATHSDDTGTPRPDLWRQGIEQFLEMRAAQESEPGPPNLGTTWTQIGPQPLVIEPAQYQYQGTGPDSGEVLDIAIDPSGGSDKTVYIATNDGGIWKTENGGQSWKAMTDTGCPDNSTPCPSLSMGAVALDPQNHEIVYAGTGSPFDGGDSFTKGVGIYKSTDGGSTWALLNPGGIFGDRNHLGAAINRIAVWFHRPPGGVAAFALLVATNKGLFRSVDGGNNFGNNAPKFDNGKPVLPGYITDLKVESFLRPQAVASVYAAVCTPDALGDCRTGKGIFRSPDGGVTFTNLFKEDGSNGAPPKDTFGFISFAQTTFVDKDTKLRKVRIYASVSKPLRQRYGYGSLGDFLHLYRSDDSGTTWTEKPAADPAGNGGTTGSRSCQCGYDQTIGVDPQNPDLLYLGFQELFQSMDGGDTFPMGPPPKRLPLSITTSKVHFDHHAIAFSPFPHWNGMPTRVWVGTDGGIASSTDAGVKWDNLNGMSPNAIATNLFFQIDIGRGVSGRPYTYGGTQDTGTIEHRPEFNGNDWHLAVDGDGSPAAVDPTMPLRAYGASNGNGKFTDDGGKTTWKNFPTADLPSAWRYAIDPNNPMNIFAITSVDRANDETDGAPGPDLYRSKNQGTSFEKITRLLGFGANVRSIANTSANSNLLWLGLESGTLWRSDNALAATPTYIKITDPKFPARPVGGIAINPMNPKEVVVVYEGFCGGTCDTGGPYKHAFATIDGGLHWSDISGAMKDKQLLDLPTHSVVIDGTTRTVVVSNDAGVMSSTNGTTWQVLGKGLPVVDSKSLQIDTTISPALLRLGTYGRSVWELK